MRKIKLPALLALFAVVIPAIYADTSQITYYAEKIIFPLENLVTLDGKPFDPAIVRGKYIFLNFWATWCPYCAAEKPSIQKLYDNYADTDFSVLTVITGEDSDTVREYMKTENYDFPVVINKDAVFKTTFAPRIPATYILDRQGYILGRINGNKDWEDTKSLKILTHIIPGFEKEL